MLPTVLLLISCASAPDKAIDTSPAATTTDSTPPTTTTTPPTTPPSERPPLWFGGAAPPSNIFILSIDTLRRDHLTRWGGPGLTPFMDSLVTGGVALDDHVQCSNWTFASMSCTTLGRPGRDLEWVPQLAGDARRKMPEAGTIPRWLRDEAGFFTLVNSINGWFSDEWHTLQGYDRRMGRGPGAEAAIAAAADSLQDAIADGNVKDHWLMHVHVTEPHVPYAPPEEYLGALADLPPLDWDVTVGEYHYDATATWPSLTTEEQGVLLAHLRARYEAEVRWLDDQVERAFADLESRGLLDDTLVVVYNDHGESFWEHGAQTHAHTLHAQENNGILFFWSKTLVPGSWSGPTHSTDLAATLLDLHGVTVPPEVDGVPLGTAPSDRLRFQFSVARQGVLQAVIQGDHKLHYDWDDGRLELYDRATDPDELTDLVTEQTERVDELWEHLRPEVEALDPLLEQSPVWPERTGSSTD